MRKEAPLERYAIDVQKQYLQFCSAHFILFKGRREALHGHNFHCSVRLEGDLTPDGYVIDFGDVKAAARHACDAIDHRVLLPGASPAIRLERNDRTVSAYYQEALLFVLPAEDVCILPLANVTVEQLARYLAGEIFARLPAETRGTLRRLVVAVEESPGQRASYDRDLQGDDGSPADAHARL